MNSFELAEAIQLAAKKMPCIACGAIPCDVVFLQVNHAAPEPRTRADLVIVPGYCRKHIPKRKRVRGADVELELGKRGASRQAARARSKEPLRSKCPACGDWCIDGKATCGRAACGSSTGRAPAPKSKAPAASPRPRPRMEKPR